MSNKSQFNVFIAGTNGVFKGVKLSNKECIQKCIQNIGSITTDNVVTAMSWGDETETDILMACGTLQNRCYKIYNTQNGLFQDSRLCNKGDGKVVGISRYEETIITAVQSGQIILWPKNDLDDGTEIVLEADKNLHRMRHSNFEKNIVATGGEENPLKLFDINQKQMIFTAKNVRHDSLELRVPVSIKDIGFLNNQVVTVGKYGHVRLYDPKAQRRPVINLEIKDESLLHLAVCPKENSKKIIVGSGKGIMKLVDLRKPGKILNTYKGSAGGVSAISFSKTNPLVVSVGLDRFIRVHNVDTKNEIRRAYLTSKTSCMLVRSDFTLDEAENEKDVYSFDDEIEEIKKDNLVEEDEKRDSEYEELFENMETIGEKRKKSNKLVEKKRKTENSDLKLIKTKKTRK